MDQLKTGSHRFRKAPAQPAPPWRGLFRGLKRLHASSLAFKTLLALVPALVLCMALLSAGLFQSQRERFLDRLVDLIYPVDAAGLDLGPQERRSIQRLNEEAKERIRDSVGHFAAHAGKVGLLGLGAFFLMLLLLMRDVEHSFNLLWGLKTRRPWARQALRHAAFLLSAPVAAVLFLSLDQGVRHLLGPLAGAGRWAADTALPVAFLGLAFAGLYAWVPNTRVEARAALLAGAGTALFLETGRRALTWYAVHIVTRSHLYGALWAVPVILLWFYLSWVIILLGAEAAYLIQTRGRT